MSYTNTRQVFIVSRLWYQGVVIIREYRNLNAECWAFSIRYLFTWLQCLIAITACSLFTTTHYHSIGIFLSHYKRKQRTELFFDNIFLKAKVVGFVLLYLRWVFVFLIRSFNCFCKKTAAHSIRWNGNVCWNTFLLFLWNCFALKQSSEVSWSRTCVFIYLDCVSMLYSSKAKPEYWKWKRMNFFHYVRNWILRMVRIRLCLLLH